MPGSFRYVPLVERCVILVSETRKFYSEEISLDGQINRTMMICQEMPLAGNKGVFLLESICGGDKMVSRVLQK